MSPVLEALLLLGAGAAGGWWAANFVSLTDRRIERAANNAGDATQRAHHVDQAADALRRDVDGLARRFNEAEQRGFKR
jgi:hypothetical protein